MVVADIRQRKMPLPDDREPDRCQVLDFPEAVLLTNPIEEEFKGEVFTFIFPRLLYETTLVKSLHFCLNIFFFFLSHKR